MRNTIELLFINQAIPIHLAPLISSLLLCLLPAGDILSTGDSREEARRFR